MSEPRPARIANAPCSWGVIGGGPAVGGERMLDELVAAGYHGTELGDYGFLPTDPALLRASLERRGLTLLGGFVGVELHRADAVSEARGEVLRVARLMAAAAPSGRRPLFILADADGRDPVRALHAGRIGPEQALSGDDLRRFAERAEEVARWVAGETGLATAFHPHGGGWIETPDEVDALLSATDPDLIGLVFDTAHHVYGSGVPDPGDLAAAGIDRFWGRIRTVHLKDCAADVAARARGEGWAYERAVRAGLYCELGRGSVDFAAVLGTLGRHGYDDWLTVEQDVFPGMGTPLESARRNRAYLASLGAT